MITLCVALFWTGALYSPPCTKVSLLEADAAMTDCVRFAPVCTFRRDKDTVVLDISLLPMPRLR